MLLAGVHPKVVSEMLGHSSVAFTLDIYSHVVPGIQEAAARRLDEVLELGEARDVGKMSAKRCETDETGRKTKQEWQDSNPRPAVLETAALPTELHSYGSNYIIINLGKDSNYPWGDSNARLAV